MLTTETRGIRIGVDVGGTFTDLQILDVRTQRITSLKTLTTPEDPSVGLLSGLKEAAARDGFELSEVGYLLHGTTIATNAVLEGKLARGALVTTAGFEDVIEIGRHVRREIYSLNPRVPPPLIPRDRRIGVAERTKYNGEIEFALARSALSDLLEKLDRLEVASVAVCLFNSYVNATHETQIFDYLERHRPSLRVSCSSALNAEIREYERTATTALNALLMPVIAGYLDRLCRRMQMEGLSPRVLLVQSNGGVCTVETAAQQPVRLLLSGPSGGAAACALLSNSLGMPNVIGVDMGGTSFDVSLTREGKVTLISQGEIDLVPVRLPMVEIRAIGAGGGSIAAVQPGGRLTVGPESAGASPGPVCYGRGGTRPTVTDANVVLGRLGAHSFLGGEMPLDVDRARAALMEQIARPLNLSLESGASGLLSVVNANLGASIRISLFEKGLDPRDFAMVAFGGAAGLHATSVADELEIGCVIFPENASTLSAFGILNSDVVHDLVRSQVFDALPENFKALQGIVESLLDEAQARFEADGMPVKDRDVNLAADVRYRGQAFELTVPVPSVTFTQQVLLQIVKDFHDLHRQRFSYSNPGTPVEIVSLRVSAIGLLPKTSVRTSESPVSAAQRIPTVRDVWIGDSWCSTPVWRRDDLMSGAGVEGPAIIEEAYTTVFLDHGWSCRREGGHLIAKANKP